MTERLDPLARPKPMLKGALQELEIEDAWSQVESTPWQIRRETELSFDWHDEEADEEALDAQGNEEAQGEALGESPVQETDGVYEAHEAWNLSQGLMRAGLKDCARVATRKAGRLKDGKGRIACIGPQYGAEVVATRDIPTGTAVRMGLKRRIVPLRDGTEELKPIKGLSVAGSKPRRTMVDDIKLPEARLNPDMVKTTGGDGTVAAKGPYFPGSFYNDIPDELDPGIVKELEEKGCFACGDSAGEGSKGNDQETVKTAIFGDAEFPPEEEADRLLTEETGGLVFNAGLIKG